MYIIQLIPWDLEVNVLQIGAGVTTLCTFVACAYLLL